MRAGAPKLSWRVDEKRTINVWTNNAAECRARLGKGCYGYVLTMPLSVGLGLVKAVMLSFQQLAVVVEALSLSLSLGSSSSKQVMDGKSCRESFSGAT